ncbi:hypothetical protein, partial [Burkholderia sp. BCC0398]
LLSAQGHEHDISNAPLATPVYTVPNFNSLLGPSLGPTVFAIDGPPDVPSVEDLSRIAIYVGAPKSSISRAGAENLCDRDDCIDASRM